MRIARIALSLSLLTACADNSEELSPTEKCQTVQSNLCDRAMECINNTNHASCVTEVNFTSQNCDGITAVADSYDACIAQIDMADCMTLFPGTPGVPPISPPEMCHGTFMH